MNVTHGDYLCYEIPSSWMIEETDDATSVYDSNGKGAITLSFYTAMDVQQPFDEHICVMAKKFIDENQIKLHRSLVLDATLKDKLVLHGTGTGADNWFIKFWIIAKQPKIVLATYHSERKTSEVRKADLKYSTVSGFCFEKAS